MSRNSSNTDIIAVSFIVVFTLVCSAVSGLARHPSMQRYDNMLEQRIQERIEPGIMKIHERIAQSLERELGKLRSY